MQRYLNNLLHNVVAIFKTYLSLDKPVHLIEIEKKKQKQQQQQQKQEQQQ